MSVKENVMTLHNNYGMLLKAQNKISEAWQELNKVLELLGTSLAQCAQHI